MSPRSPAAGSWSWRCFPGEADRSERQACAESTSFFGARQPRCGRLEVRTGLWHDRPHHRAATGLIFNVGQESRLLHNSCQWLVYGGPRAFCHPPDCGRNRRVRTAGIGCRGTRPRMRGRISRRVLKRKTVRWRLGDIFDEDFAVAENHSRARFPQFGSTIRGPFRP